MDEATFQKRLAELIAEIDTLPVEERDKLRSMAVETKKRVCCRSVRQLVRSP